MLINLLRLLGLSTNVAASPPPPPVDEMTKRGKVVGLQSLAGTKEASPSAAKTGVENPKALVSDDDDKMRKICYYGCVNNHGLSICVCPTDSSSEAPSTDRRGRREPVAKKKHSPCPRSNRYSLRPRSNIRAVKKPSSSAAKEELPVRSKAYMKGLCRYCFHPTMRTCVNGCTPDVSSSDDDVSSYKSPLKPEIQELK